MLIDVNGAAGRGGGCRWEDRGPALYLCIHQLRTGYSRYDDGVEKAACVQYVL